MLNEKKILEQFPFFNLKILDEIIALIKQSKNIALIGHLDPDGDSINSMMALKESLTNLGHQADAVNEGPYKSRFYNINKKHILKSIDKIYDLYIIVDTPVIERLGSLKEKIDFNKAIVIDHHYTNIGFGKLNWVDDSFISTSEMIFILLVKMNINLENSNICQNLLNGVLSDNGFFQHIQKNKNTSLLISYLLINIGANPKHTYNILFGGQSLANKKLLALAIERIESKKGGKILYTYITDKDKKKLKRASDDSLSIFKEMMSIKGVIISIYFKISKEKVEISFRSNEQFDVSAIAKHFGGGGHKAASGASIVGNFDEIKTLVLKKTEEFLKLSK